MAVERDRSGRSRSRHLQETDRQYKVFLYVFYLCAFIMLSVTVYGTYTMVIEWEENGTYVMGESLVITHIPFDNFAKPVTWLFFAAIIGWYCDSRIGWKRTTAKQLGGTKMALLQLMLLGFAIICGYEVLWNFAVLNAQIAAGIEGGAVPDIDRLYVAYPDPDRPWNLVFATKIFLVGTIISAHALYLSTRPRKTTDDL